VPTSKAEVFLVSWKSNPHVNRSTLTTLTKNLLSWADPAATASQAALS